ncbi:DNA replication/repair protein RecF [Acetobacter orientalis]|uniref:DNA replication/repair protein RecF n=1 Tax=Acetobacter orientalis TaxID=146474 RepID=UPI00386DD38C
MLRLCKLTLTQFRNYQRLVWEPEGALVVLTGENGSGKTNLLEAVSLLTAGRGLRRAPLTQLGHHNATEWGIAARLELTHEIIDLATGVAPHNDTVRRVHFLNGKPIKQKDSVEDVFSAVWITPQMDRLFSESASGRRRFLDRLVMGTTPYHAKELLAYDRAMVQRNKLLQTRRTEHVWLAGLEASMARHAVAISAARNEVAQHLCHAAQTTHSEFPATLMHLECPIGAELQRKPALEVEDWLKETLAVNRTIDREKGRACMGTHRSDFTLTDCKTGLMAATASTGQQKAMLLGIILAHATLVAEYRGAPPMLLLDEPLVHLDQKKRQALLEHLQNIETTTILTGTDPAPFEALAGKAHFTSLKNGNFVP